MFSSWVSDCAVLEYLDPSAEASREALLDEAPKEEERDVAARVPEEEVQRRVQEARDAARLEVEQRLRMELDRERKEVDLKLTKTLHQFAQERASYFNRVEAEVVQLALAIARKVLQREAALDPTLLAALVRVALERMQNGRPTRVVIPPEEFDRWRALGHNEAGAPHWEAVADDTLKPGDCVVETELGHANFGFEAQLMGIEESFTALMAHKPDRT